MGWKEKEINKKKELGFGAHNVWLTFSRIIFLGLNSASDIDSTSTRSNCAEKSGIDWISQFVNQEGLLLNGKSTEKLLSNLALHMARILMLVNLIMQQC